jgi:hypothetical protein
MRTPAGTRWLRSLAIASWVLAGLLAGCSDPQKPASLPTASRSTEATSAPTPTATPVEQQVEAAVRAYYAELTRAIRSGDADTLATLSAKTCPCWGSVQGIRKLASKGQRSPKAQIVLRAVKVHDVIARSAGAEVTYHVSSYDLVDSKGAVVTKVPARSDHIDLSLISMQGRWVLTNVFDLEAS